MAFETIAQRKILSRNSWQDIGDNNDYNIVTGLGSPSEYISLPASSYLTWGKSKMKDKNMHITKDVFPVPATGPVYDIASSEPTYAINANGLVNRNQEYALATACAPVYFSITGGEAVPMDENVLETFGSGFANARLAKIVLALPGAHENVKTEVFFLKQVGFEINDEKNISKSGRKNNSSGYFEVLPIAAGHFITVDTGLHYVQMSRTRADLSTTRTFSLFRKRRNDIFRTENALDPFVEVEETVGCVFMELDLGSDNDNDAGGSSRKKLVTSSVGLKKNTSFLQESQQLSFNEDDFIQTGHGVSGVNFRRRSMVLDSQQLSFNEEDFSQTGLGNNGPHDGSYAQVLPGNSDSASSPYEDMTYYDYDSYAQLGIELVPRPPCLISKDSVYEVISEHPPVHQNTMSNGYLVPVFQSKTKTSDTNKDRVPSKAHIYTSVNKKRGVTTSITVDEPKKNDSGGYFAAYKSGETSVDYTEIASDSDEEVLDTYVDINMTQDKIRNCYQIPYQVEEPFKSDSAYATPNLEGYTEIDCAYEGMLGDAIGRFSTIKDHHIPQEKIRNGYLVPYQVENSFEGESAYATPNFVHKSDCHSHEKNSEIQKYVDIKTSIDLKVLHPCSVINSLKDDNGDAIYDIIEEQKANHYAVIKPSSIYVELRGDTTTDEEFTYTDKHLLDNISSDEIHKDSNIEPYIILPSSSAYDNHCSTSTDGHLTNSIRDLDI